MRCLVQGSVSHLKVFVCFKIQKPDFTVLLPGSLYSNWFNSLLNITFKIDLFFIFYVWEFCCVSVYVHTYMPGVCGDQKRALDLLKLEFQVIVNCHVDAESITRVF